MDSKTLEAAKGFVDAIVRLATQLGTWPTVILVIALAGMWLARGIFQDRQRERMFKSMVEEKEKEIERLAESNRDFRETILRFKGYPEHLLQADAKDSEQAKDKRRPK